MYQQSFDFEPNPQNPPTYVVNRIRVKPINHELSRVSISLMGGDSALRDFYNSLGKGESLDSVSGDVILELGSNHPAHIDGLVQPKYSARFPDGTEFWWSGSAKCFRYKLTESECLRLSTLLKGLTMSICEPVGGFGGTLSHDKEFMEIKGTYPILEAEDVPDLQSRVQFFLATHLL